jgi:hypothetical protein
LLCGDSGGWRDVILFLESAPTWCLVAPRKRWTGDELGDAWEGGTETTPFIDDGQSNAPCGCWWLQRVPSRVHLRCRLCMLCHRDDRTLAFAAPPCAAASCPRGRSSSPSAFCSSWQVPMMRVLSTHSHTTLLPQRGLFEHTSPPPLNQNRCQGKVGTFQTRSGELGGLCNFWKWETWHFYWLSSCLYVQ